MSRVIKSNNLQRGAALVVSLIILAVITIIGVAGIQNSTLEMKMAATAKDRAEAFEAAESALLQVELALKQNPPTLNQLSSNCAGTGCYKSDCDEGRCFKGIYINGDGKANCQVVDAAATNYTEALADLKDDQKMDITVTSSPEKVKVVQEFLCFVEKYNAGIPVTSEENSERTSLDALNDNLVPLFRVTAVAQGSNKRSTAVLQSTFKVVN